MTTEESSQVLTSLFQQMVQTVQSPDIEDGWVQRLGLASMPVSGLLNPAKYQYLNMIRDRVLEMKQHAWEDEGAIRQQLPELYDARGSFIGWLNRHAELIDYGKVDNALASAINDNYLELAQGAKQPQWWIDHHDNVLAALAGLSCDPVSKLRALNKMKQGAGIDEVLETVGLYLAEMRTKQPIDVNKLRVDMIMHYYSTQSVQQIVDDYLVANYGRYGHGAMVKMNNDVDDAIHQIAETLIQTYYPEGIVGDNAGEVELKFIQEHGTRARAQMTVTEGWIIRHLESSGAVADMKDRVTTDLQIMASNTINQLYAPELVERLKAQIHFVPVIDGLGANELSEAIRLFESVGVAAVAEHFNMPEAAILAGDYVPQSGFNAQDMLIDQLNQDWDEALGHFAAEYELDDNPDGLEADLMPLSTQLNTELNQWMDSHEQKLKTVQTASELNVLLAADQVRFLNASLIYQRMKQNQSWTNLKEDIKVVADMRISGADADAVASDLRDTCPDVLADKGLTDPATLEWHVESALADASEEIADYLVSNAGADLGQLSSIANADGDQLYQMSGDFGRKTVLNNLEGA